MAEQSRDDILRELNSLDKGLAANALARGEGLISNEFTLKLEDADLYAAYIFREFPPGDTDYQPPETLDKLLAFMRTEATSRGLAWDRADPTERTPERTTEDRGL